MSESQGSFETIRPLLVEASVLEGEDHARVRVALEVSGELYVAESPLSGATGDPVAESRGGAEATVQGLGLFTPDAVALELQWHELLRPGGDLPPVAVAVVAVDVAGVPMRYAGAALVRADAPVAGAKATLDAINRRLGVTGL